MGLLLSKRNQKKAPHVILLGLDSAGKSTLLFRLHRGEAMKTQPTLGFNVGMLEVEKNVALTVWDVGGQAAMRPHWKHFMEGCKAVVFIVDSSDRERMPQAQAELRRVLRDDNAKNVPLMVLANKQDLPGVMTVHEVSEALNLPSYLDREWQIQACSGLQNQGLTQALHSIAKMINVH